jgi:outer membrane lipoprotein carrier protein
LDASKYGKDFSEMEVWLSTKDASPMRLVSIDRLGNASNYEISNLKKLDRVNRDDFVLKPTKGVDIIDMR